MAVSPSPIEAFNAGDLMFIIEETWMSGHDHDVIFWESGCPMQHCHVVGVPQGRDPVEYASGLAESRGDLLLLQLRDIHASAAAFNKGRGL